MHPSLAGGPPLVHVGRVPPGGGLDEMEDLDLDASRTSVIVVEWGEGKAEELSEDRLEIVIERGDTDERTVTLAGVGPRWADTTL